MVWALRAQEQIKEDNYNTPDNNLEQFLKHVPFFHTGGRDGIKNGETRKRFVH